MFVSNGLNIFFVCLNVTVYLVFFVNCQICEKLEDGAPYHWSKVVTDFLKKKKSMYWHGSETAQISTQSRICGVIRRIRWHTSNRQALKIWGKQSRTSRTLKSLRSTANLWYPTCCVASKQSLTAKDDILKQSPSKNDNFHNIFDVSIMTE